MTGFPPALMIAAPASGSGKTTVTLAILRALARRGNAVGSFKTGPDYIDPAFHTAASGQTCFNLDPWAMSDGTLNKCLSAASEQKDLLVGEAVMGLFDGAKNGEGSSADLAKKLNIPVILVVDARGQAGSVGAVLHGFNNFDPDLTVTGVIFNAIGGPGHRALLEEAAEKSGIPCLGCLPKRPELALEHRHLGLIQARENSDLDLFLETAADLVEEHLDLDHLQKLARPLHPVEGAAGTLLPPSQRIAVARDDAFAFSYPHLLEGWREAGAEIVPFSPLNDEAPDNEAGFIYLPGGYPELHAARLSNAEIFRHGMKKAAEQDVQIFGECGGYMVLGLSLTDKAGDRFDMLDLLPVETSFAEPKLHLGYRQASLAQSCFLGDAGKQFRAHEFHYSTVVTEDRSSPLFTLKDASDRELQPAGIIRDKIAGSYIHLIDGAAS